MKKQQVKIVIAFAAIYIIWGTTYMAIRVAVTTIPAFLMAGVRFMSAGIITLAVLRSQGVPMPDRIQWRSAAVVGAFLLFGGNGFVTWSEQEIPSGIAALVVATVPVWMTFIGWLLFGKERPGKMTVGGITLGMAGIVLLVGPGQWTGGSAVDLPSLLVLCCAPILWSIGSLYSARARLPQNAFMSTALEMMTGGGILFIAGLITGEGAALRINQISAHSLLALLYLTVFGSIAALTSYVWLLKTVDPAKVSTYTYVNPPIAILFGYLVLGEPISARTLLAMAIILAAVLAITLGRRRVPRREPGPSRAASQERELVVAGD